MNQRALLQVIGNFAILALIVPTAAAIEAVASPVGLSRQANVSVFTEVSDGLYSRQQGTLGVDGQFIPDTTAPESDWVQGETFFDFQKLPTGVPLVIVDPFDSWLGMDPASLADLSESEKVDWLQAAHFAFGEWPYLTGGLSYILAQQSDPELTYAFQQVRVTGDLPANHLAGDYVGLIDGLNPYHPSSSSMPSGMLPIAMGVGNLPKLAKLTVSSSGVFSFRWPGVLEFVPLRQVERLRGRVSAGQVTFIGLGPVNFRDSKYRDVWVAICPFTFQGAAMIRLRITFTVDPPLGPPFTEALSLTLLKAAEASDLDFRNDRTRILAKSFGAEKDFSDDYVLDAEVPLVAAVGALRVKGSRLVFSGHSSIGDRIRSSGRAVTQTGVAQEVSIPICSKAGYFWVGADQAGEATGYCHFSNKFAEGLIGTARQIAYEKPLNSASSSSFSPEHLYTSGSAYHWNGSLAQGQSFSEQLQMSVKRNGRKRLRYEYGTQFRAKVRIIPNTGIVLGSAGMQIGGRKLKTKLVGFLDQPEARLIVYGSFYPAGRPDLYELTHMFELQGDPSAASNPFPSGNPLFYYNGTQNQVTTITDF